MLEVRETNLAAQLFSARSDSAPSTCLRDFYEDTTEDAYLMQFRYRASEADQAAGNRIERMAADCRYRANRGWFARLNSTALVASDAFQTRPET